MCRHSFQATFVGESTYTEKLTVGTFLYSIGMSSYQRQLLISLYSHPSMNPDNKSLNTNLALTKSRTVIRWSPQLPGYVIPSGRRGSEEET